MQNFKCRPGKSRWCLLFIPLGLLPLIFVPILQTYIYVSCYTLVSSMLFLYNCPFFIQCLHIKPIYFEDLQVDENIDSTVKTKFQDIFTRALNVLLAMALTILVNYTLYKMKDSPLSIFELFGLLGGIISLYRTIWDYIGKILLKILIIKKTTHQAQANLRGSFDHHDPLSPSNSLSPPTRIHGTTDSPKNEISSLPLSSYSSPSLKPMLPSSRQLSDFDHV